MTKRCCIVGTAESWRQTPWDDPGMRIISLNDAYQLPGFKRADEWADLHPLDKFFHPPKDRHIMSHEIPPGHYLRPATHLEWLRNLKIPVWLAAPQPDWPHAQAFPWDDVFEWLGHSPDWNPYVMSTPALLLAHKILEGYTEIWITGIHLATEWEYLQQRPNFEHIMGRFLGRGKLKIAVKDGFRYYESPDGLLVFPMGSPVLTGDHIYAREPKPGHEKELVKWELHKVQVKMGRAVAALKTRKWWQRVGPIQEELWRLEAAAEDRQQQLQRMQLGA